MSTKVNLSTLIAAHPEVQKHLNIDGCFKFQQGGGVFMMKNDCIFCSITWNYIGEPCALLTKREFRIKLQWREGIASTERIGML
jgi:hypothetical protein